ncbi:hypothetical protein HID58_091625 [Brassica napus]|uniref:PHD finger protein ALFIN-LIKE n=1 Tax=Brassica napus TaxID=3708 RepID=A0ABQ7X1C9_BRANA|nr:hypothetical protein HID58_091625 [Brassica napus]
MFMEVRSRSFEERSSRSKNGSRSYKLSYGMVMVEHGGFQSYKENLSLYGYPDGTWDVQEARMLLPPNLPEPTVGINLARDRMRAIDWVTVVAEHCDSWLLSLAFLFGVDLSHDDRIKKSHLNLVVCFKFSGNAADLADVAVSMNLLVVLKS